MVSVSATALPLWSTVVCPDPCDGGRGDPTLRDRVSMHGLVAQLGASVLRGDERINQISMRIDVRGRKTHSIYGFI